MILKMKFKEGDWVIIRTKQPKKYEPHWYGPYKVVRPQLFGTYELETPKGIKYHTLIHADRMVKARVEGRTTRGWRMPPKRGRPSDDTAERDEHISYAPAPDNDRVVSVSTEDFREIPTDEDGIVQEGENE